MEYIHYTDKPAACQEPINLVGAFHQMGTFAGRARAL
jgi:hypothetical protein